MHIQHRRSASRPRLISLCILSLVTLLAAALPARADYVLLGPADGLAMDQPRVTFGLAIPNPDPEQPDTLVGPLLYNNGLLDTGANGILLGQLAFAGGESYTQATRPDDSVVYYDEQGVAGTSPLSVLVPYDLHVLDSGDAANGISPVEFEVPDVTAFASPTLNLGSFGAIVGMPAMAGKYVNMDLTPITSLDFMGVQIGDTPIPTTPDSYHVQMSMLEPVHTGQRQEGDPLPTFAALPILDNITVHNKKTGMNDTGSMLLDTGAQTAIISEDTAAALGIDFTRTVAEGGDVVDIIEVGGVGGNTVIPMVVVDELRLPTVEGVDMVWTNVVAGVLDIPGITGVFGMNMLTSGYTGATFGGTSAGDLLSDEDFIQSLADLGLISDPDDPVKTLEELTALLGSGLLETSLDPYFTNIVLDFTDPTVGIMRLDLNPEVNNVIIPEPATAALMCLATGVLLTMRKRKA